VQRSSGIARHAQAFADGIIETVREPLLVLDHDLKIMRANKAFFTAFGVRSEDAQNHAVTEVGDDFWKSAELNDRLSGVLTRDEPFDLEVVHAPETQGRRIYCLNGRRFAGNEGLNSLIVLSFDDITEARARTESLLADGLRMKEFLAMLAHELRNPLAPISYAVGLLKRGAADKTGLYEMIERQTTRLVRLVDDLLDVARISRGLIELQREPVDLRTTIRNAVKAGQERVELRQHKLSLSLPLHAVNVDGDGVRLEQVMTNLLENAVKYTEPGGEISVILAASDTDAILTVSDNGIGIEPEALEHIFDLFNQVDSSLSRSGGGLGLGLTVVRRILELHGATIEATSAGLGAGSRFIVRIPLLTVPKHVARPAQVEEIGLDASVSRRVLIVDDNKDSAECVAMMVRTWGHEALVVHDATHALAVAESFSADAALLDIGLPDMDGHALGKRLRELSAGRKLLLLALTGYGRAEDRAASLDAGFDAHLVKPVDPDVLETLLAAQ
jgi:two-component system CheB/CheR fusion protein